MKGLYREKYLIAVYDKNDYLIDVACLPNELTCFKNQRRAIEYMSKIVNGHRRSSRFFLIDVTEKHNDIFAEEDQLFLEYVKSKQNPLNQTEIDKQKASELGISLRTYQRRKALYKEYNNLVL